eukprot:4210731-Pleurochrysis_carterae.AAC.2
MACDVCGLGFRQALALLLSLGATKVGNDALKKHHKIKQAQANLSMQVSPVAVEVFSGLYNLVANLQLSDGGNLLSPLRQTA